MLKGVVGLITGAASGLGKATAHHVIKQGGSVVICDLPKSKGAEVAATLGKNAVFCPCDISSEHNVKEALSVCEEKFGQLNLVVNCAGIARAFATFTPGSQNIYSCETFQELLQTNLIGAFNVFRLAPQLIYKNASDSDGERGVMIQAGCSSSFDGCYGQSGFAACKGAVTSMMLPLSLELNDLGIRTVTITTSLADTPLTSEYCLTVMPRRYYQRLFLIKDRFVQPEEFAALVEEIYRNKYLNGTDVRLTGGVRMFS